MESRLIQDIVLVSLSSRLSLFITNFYMHSMEKSLDQLHATLKMAKADMKKEVPQVLMVNKVGDKVKKGKNKGKRKANNKGKGIAKNPISSKAKVTTDSKCFYYKSKGH